MTDTVVMLLPLDCLNDLDGAVAEVVTNIMAGEITLVEAVQSQAERRGPVSRLIQYDLVERVRYELQEKLRNEN